MYCVASCIMNYLIHGSNDVYSCLLDVNKTFDRIHYKRLFYILLDKKCLSA